MAVEIGQAYVSITASAKGIGKSVQDELGGPVTASAEQAGDQAGGRFHDAFGSHLKKLAAVASGAFAGLKAAEFLKDSIGAASDLAESISKVGVVFADSAPEIRAWASDAAENLGQSEQEALEAAGTFGNLFRAMNIGTPVAADMSKKIIGLAGDLASFNNANPEDVLVALKAGLVGETEPLRAFGVNINDARLKAEAYGSGLVKATVDQDKLAKAQIRSRQTTIAANEAVKKYGEGSEQAQIAIQKMDIANTDLSNALGGDFPKDLDAATKAQAAFSLIMKDTSLAQGDFARTSDGLANRQRILSAKFKDLKATLGTQLLPVVNAVGGFLLDKVVPGFQALANAISGNAISSSEGFIGVMGRIGSTVREVVGFIVGNFPKVRDAIVPVIEKVGSVLGTVFGFVMDHKEVLVGLAVVIGGALVAAFAAWAVSAGAAAVATIAAAAPVIAIGAALAALVAGIIYAYKHFEIFRTVVDTVVGFVVNHWRLLLAVLTGGLGVAVLLIIKHWDSIKAVAGAFVGWFNTNVVPVLKAGWELISAAVTAAWGVFQTMIAIVTPILGALLSIAGSVFGQIKGVIETFVAVVGPLISGWINAALIVVSTVINTIKDVIEGVLGVIRGIFQAITGLISGDWGQFWDGIKTIASSVFGAVTGIIDGVWNGIKGLFQTGIDTVKSVVSNGIDTVVGFFSGIGGRISSAASGMWDGIKDAFRSAINAVIRMWNGIEFKIPGFKVGPIGYDGFTLGVPDIPQLAAGGIATRAGIAVVGERGAETVYLPQGAEVVPGTGGRSPIVQNFYGQEMSPRRVADEVAWVMRFAGR